MAQFNPTDTITLDVPLFIRLLEYAREDAKTDMDLHKVTENILALSEEGSTLTMDQYDEIVKETSSKQQMDEVKRMKQLAGLIEAFINNPGGTVPFNVFRDFVQKWLENGEQNADVSKTTSFDELQDIIDDYWGWEDEQTVWMLSSFIESILI